MQIIKCSNCGSDDLSFDAVVTWNPTLDKFEILDVLPYAYCERCEGHVPAHHEEGTSCPE